MKTWFAKNSGILNRVLTSTLLRPSCSTTVPDLIGSLVGKWTQIPTIGLCHIISSVTYCTIPYHKKNLSSHNINDIIDDVFTTWAFYHLTHRTRTSVAGGGAWAKISINSLLYFGQWSALSFPFFILMFIPYTSKKKTVLYGIIFIYCSCLHHYR